MFFGQYAQYWNENKINSKTTYTKVDESQNILIIKNISVTL